MFFFICCTLPPFIRDVQCAALLVYIVSSYTSLNWKSEGHRFGLNFASAFSFSCRLCSIFVFPLLRSILFFCALTVLVLCVSILFDVLLSKRVGEVLVTSTVTVSAESSEFTGA